MCERTIRVLHVLIARRIRGETEVLHYPHPRWHDLRTGGPFLAQPTTRLIADEDVEAKLAAVFRDDLGLSDLGSPAWRRLGDAQARLVSPTGIVPTTYHIAPVLARLPVGQHQRLARRLNGRWLAPATALGLADLSPTARAVLESLANAEALLPPVSATGLTGTIADRAWTARLLAARDGDLEQFGLLMGEIRPALVEGLRRCRWTRALAERPDEVEDVLADAAVRTLESLELFDPARGTASMWLWTITRNTAINRLRRRGRSCGLSSAMADLLEGREENPFALAAAREEVGNVARRLEKVLQAAPLRVRQVWTMRMEQGQPYAEIAATLDLPVGTIATWIRRVRRQAQGGRSGKHRTAALV